MTPHDLELKQYNAIMERLELIALKMNELYSNRREYELHRYVEDGIYLCAVWALDAKDKFKKYGERQQ